MSAPRVFVRSARAVTTRNLPQQIQFSYPRITSAKATYTFSNRHFSTTRISKMPADLKQSDVNSQTDPSVARQYDTETPIDEQIKKFFELCDAKKICMLSTYRKGTGPVGRSMAIARRDGPDFLFLANGHSQKFNDLNEDKECQLMFQDDKTQDWISVTGTATTTDNSDPRIKEVWSHGAAAWFGDLGDGVHTGKADDPRMTLIEVKAKYIVYYAAEVGKAGYMKEIAVATATGKVAHTGSLRELKEGDIESARKM